MKNPKKHKKSPLTPTWEEEETEEPQVSIDEKKRLEDLDRELFLEAATKGPLKHKDHNSSDTHQNLRSPRERSQKKPHHHEIDLHGLSVHEAEQFVESTINQLLDQAKGQPILVRIITGKGHHSKGSPQLNSSIHRMVEMKYHSRIITIEASPHELRLGHTFLKGHFDVKLK